MDKFEDPNLLILSADHDIQNIKKFVETIQNGLRYSENGRLVTFGVIPNKPETGYGYIESEKELNNSDNEGEKNM